MNKVIEILKQLEKTSGRIDKENILLQNFNNQKLKDILFYSMNPFYIFGIGSKTFNKKLTGKNEFNDIFEVLDYLLKNNTGTDIIKEKVNNFINSQPEDHKEWYQRIVLKNLRIGVTEKTVNKIWKDLIPVFDVMLAQPFDRLFDCVACEVKLDGVRILAIKQNGSTNLFTRNGKLIEGYNDLLAEINQLEIDNMVFDGEIISGNYTGTMNNLFNKENNKQGVFNVFDILTLEEFYKGHSFCNYLVRKNMLKEYNNTENINIIQPIKIIKNPTIQELNSISEQVVKQGYEGIMVKNVSGYYELKRSYDWQKMKPFFSDEFKIVDFEEGSGKYKGTLGKVIIDVNGVLVGCGSGFSDQQRRDIWGNKEGYLGRVIEVQYQEKIPKTGSLRFPTVKGFREF